MHQFFRGMADNTTGRGMDSPQELKTKNYIMQLNRVEATFKFSFGKLYWALKVGKLKVNMSGQENSHFFLFLTLYTI